MKKHLCSICLLPLIFINSAYAQLLQECNAIASDRNARYYPSRVDSVTTIKSISCYSDNKDVVLNFNRIVDFKGVSYDQNTLNSLRPSMKNTLCTGPDTNSLLRKFTLGYKYFFDDGKYIGELKFSINECT